MAIMALLFKCIITAFTISYIDGIERDLYGR